MGRAVRIFCGLSLLLGLCVEGSTPALSEVVGSLDPVEKCLRQTGRLAVLFMVDESGSLQDTDPRHDRVVGIEAAIAGLSELAQGERGVEVSVALWGFSVNAHERNGWTPVNQGTLSALRGAAGEFRDRNRGFDTDYIAALGASNAELARRAIALDPDGSRPVCKLLLWFTDGKFDIEDRLSDRSRQAHGTSKSWAPEIDLAQPGGGARATQRGLELLCKSDGTVQQLRTDGVFNAVIALETAIAAPDRELLVAMAQGSSGSRTCGVNNAQAASSGAYLGAGDVDDLILSMFEATGASPLPGTGTAAVCPTPTPCPEGTREFVLDRTLSRFNVLAISRMPEVAVVLRSPTGQEATLSRPGATASLSSAEISWRWFSPSAVLVSGSLSRQNPEWAGTWTVTFVDTTGTNSAVRNRVEIYVFGNLEARVAPNTRLRKGEKGSIRIRVVDPDGEPETAPELLESLDVNASISVPDEKPVTLVLTAEPGGTFVGTYTPPETLKAVAVNLHTELSVRTTVGVTLPTVATDESIPVDPPVGFPAILLPESGQGVLVLSPVRALGETAKGTIDFEPPRSGGACVWLKSASKDSAPAKTEKVDFSMSPGREESSCIQISADNPASAAVSALATGYGRGRVTGDLVLGMRSDATGEIREEHVPVRFEMDVPPTVDEPRAILLLIAGVAAPILLLYILNFLTARYRRFDSVRYLVTTCVVGPGDTVTPGAGATQLFDREAVKLFPPPDSLRAFEIAGFRFEVKMPASPFAAVEGHVTVAEAAYVAGRLGTAGEGRAAKVPLGLGRTWVVALATSDLPSGVGEDGVIEGPIRVRVLALFSDDELFESQHSRTEDEIRNQLPDLVRLARSHSPAPPTDLVTAGAPGASSGPGLPTDATNEPISTELPPLPD